MAIYRTACKQVCTHCQLHIGMMTRSSLRSCCRPSHKLLGLCVTHNFHSCRGYTSCSTCHH